MKYGQLPTSLGIFEVQCQEMMFYQYMPIKLAGKTYYEFEKRLQCFLELINACAKDFDFLFGGQAFKESYMYITAKHMYQTPNNSFNRMGWHSDGFMTDDINYIWSNKFPTIFNYSDFHLTQDDIISMFEMERQALPHNDYTFAENELLRLNQFNIHKVAPVTEGGMRTFVKISFSKDKYDLIGNSRNYLLDYNWEMKARQETRNIPQSIITPLSADTCPQTNSH